MYPQPCLEVDDYQTEVGLGDLESEKVPNPTMAFKSLTQMKCHNQGGLHELPPKDVFFAATQSTAGSKTSSW